MLGRRGIYVAIGGYDPVIEETPEPKPKTFTKNGTGTVVDNATDESGKDFFTITTPQKCFFIW